MNGLWLLLWRWWWRRRWLLWWLLLLLLVLLLLAASGVGLVTVAGVSVMRERMVEDRIAKVEAVGRIAVDFAAGLQADVTAGRLTREAAMEHFRERVHAVRFGAAGD